MFFIFVQNDWSAWHFQTISNPIILSCHEVKDLEERVKSLQRGLIEKEGEVVHLRSQHEMLKVQDWQVKPTSTAQKVRDGTFGEPFVTFHQCIPPLKSLRFLSFVVTRGQVQRQVAFILLTLLVLK